MKICGIYKITNTITGDFYIGSSKDIKRRWREHKWPSTWKRYSNNPMYQDMKNYGTDKFEFQVIEEVEEEELKEIEQEFIEKLKPTYNNYNAKGLNIERRKKCCKEYEKTEKRKKCHKEYHKTDKGKESQKKAVNKYQNQLCRYNGETLTLDALRCRFKRRGISNPTQEAKKYLLNK